MAIENINDLETAEIKVNDDGQIENLSIALYKDNVMNFTNIEKFPLYTKYQIDKKIKEFEKEMTLKMQEQNIINKIYIKDESGELVESYLTLEQIAKKMNNIAYDEIGVRYNISTTNVNKIKIGEFTSYIGQRIIKKGTDILLGGIDFDSNTLNVSFDKIIFGDHTTYPEYSITKENDTFLNHYPWNKMKKVQISLDNSEYNYDLSRDNGGNYFTEVPLYYIDQRYIIEENYKDISPLNNSTVIRYRPILDITGIRNS